MPRSKLSILLPTFLLALAGLAHIYAQGPSVQIDPESVRQAVARTSDLVQENYFDPTLAPSIADTLRKRATDGKYDDLNTIELLADKLTVDLFEITQDKHLVVSVKAPKEPQTEDVKSDDTARFRRGQLENFGVQKVEILEGNVGYLNLTSFYRPEEANDTIAAAMRIVRHADALIVDVRGHSGGSPDTTVLFASYFFDQAEKPLFRIVDRVGCDRGYKTGSKLPEDRNHRRPTYLLTSKHTFSAGEGIAFLLQEQGRVQVIGERTAGAANPGRPYDVNPHIEVTIPNGRIVSAVHNSNWEGSGVTPDVAVKANEALITAHARALSALARENSEQ